MRREGALLAAVIGTFGMLSVSGSCALGSPATIESQESSQAEAIFEKARSVWEQSSYPPYVQYVVSVDVTENGKRLRSHYNGQYCASDDELTVRAFSEEEIADPVQPHGINLYLVGPYGLSAKVSRDPPPTDYMGVPKLSPVYSFGLRRSVFRPRSPTTKSALPVIGSVTSLGRTYDVRLMGEESIAGRLAYHLRLVPLREPRRYRVREMWVDADNYSTLQILTDGNFTSGPSLGARWLVMFKRINGAEYVDTEVAQVPLNFGHGRSYRDATIRFEQLRAIQFDEVWKVVLRGIERPGELIEPPE